LLYMISVKGVTRNHITLHVPALKKREKRNQVMDDGRGKFIEHKDEADAKKEMGKKFPNRTDKTSGIFKVGEVLEIRGSRFKIAYIKSNGGMTLRLQNREE